MASKRKSTSTSKSRQRSPRAAKAAQPSPGKRSPPKKRPTAEERKKAEQLARRRERDAERRAERKRAEQLAERKKAAQLKRRRERAAERKLIAEQEAARKRAERRDRDAKRRELAKREKKAGKRTQIRFDTRPAQLDAALELMRGHVAAIAGGAELEIERPPAQAKGTPWQIRAVITPADPLTYEALAQALGEIEADGKIDRWVTPNRYARIAVEYTGPESRGSKREVTREWVAAEIGPWNSAISRARRRCDPDVPDSPAAGYETTGVNELIVWLSSESGNEVPF